MRILHTGRGTSGSWQCRGVQLGHAIPKASRKQIAKADAVVLVKRPYPGFLDAVKGKPWVWDVVDAYPQPQCAGWSRSRAVQWFKSELKRLNPDGVIFPTAKMQQDCMTRIPSTVIYHHHRIDMQINPIRDRVKTVGYEGSAKYLGKWLDVIARECAVRGWGFKVNDGVHSDWDICIAFRDTPFDGYAQRHWKSNVKLANCHGSGTPFIGAAECGYFETQSGRELWLDDKDGLSDAFDSLVCRHVREGVREAFLNSAIPVDRCRAQLEDFISGLV